MTVWICETAMTSLQRASAPQGTAQHPQKCAECLPEQIQSKRRSYNNILKGLIEWRISLSE